MDSRLLIAAGVHRRRRMQNREVDGIRVGNLLKLYSPVEAQRRFDLVDDQITAMREGEITKYFQVGEEEANIRLQTKQLDALIEKANRNIEREVNYLKLIWLLAFASLYCVSLIFQGDVASKYALESSIHNSVINQLTGGIGLLYGSALFSDKASIPNSARFYDWLGSSILNRVLTQPLCGDGVCEPPTEYPGFGRFGCVPDCGRYTKTTTLAINLQNFFQLAMSDPQLTWDLSNVSLGDAEPAFAYNIYSATMDDFLFADDQPAGTGRATLVEVPDGELTLHLYQTHAVAAAVDPQLVFEQLGVLEETLPARAAGADFDYGDPRERLAVGAAGLDAVWRSCLGGIGAPDPKCFAAPPQELTVRVLGGYGLAGTISMSDGGRGRTLLAEVDFCSDVPNRTIGLADLTNKRFVADSAVPCPSSRRRWSTVRGGGAVHAADGGSSWGGRQRPASACSAGAGRGGCGRRALGVGYELGCLNDFNAVTGRVDCSLLDRGCPTYWYQVCELKLPPYLAMPVMCSNHSDCAVALEAPLCAAGGQCVPCAFCQIDADDSVTGACPQEVCPGSGGYPQCLSGERLARSVSGGARAADGSGGGGGCSTTASFGVWAYHAQGATVEVVPVSASVGTDAAAAAAAAAAGPVRTVTPGNLLVGPVMVTQRRAALGPCDAVAKPSVRTYLAGGGGGMLCRQLGVADGRPFGRDPAFLPSSSIYNGKLEIADYYDPSQVVNASTSAAGGVNVSTRAAPLGFFPYKYRLNASLLRAKEADLFRLYFDPRLTAGQAGSMVRFMADGGFIDGQTESVAVDLLAFNPSLNKFSLIGFVFSWKLNGVIEWDFKVCTFAVDLFSGAAAQTQLALQVVAMFCLAVSTCLQLKSLFHALRTYRLPLYALQPANWFHWAHTAVMWYGWWIWWGDYYLAGRSFTMDPGGYPVLQDPLASARMFQVDAGVEGRFLGLMDQARGLGDLADHYAAVAGLGAFLFILCLLESFRFQPQLGLLTRTLEFCGPDLFNFVLLFLIIFGGFSAACTLLFGHQVYKVSTLDKSLIFNSFLMMTLDPTQFWAQFGHAAPAWVFQLWAWSFLFIIGFGLFNVFLALLMDGLFNAKAEQRHAPSVPSDLARIGGQAVRGLFSGAGAHMSDTHLRDRLDARRAGLPSSKDLRRAMQVHMEDEAGDHEVRLRGGLSVSVDEVASLLRKTDQPSAAVAPAATADQAAGGSGEEGGGGGEEGGEPGTNSSASQARRLPPPLGAEEEGRLAEGSMRSVLEVVEEAAGREEERQRAQEVVTRLQAGGDPAVVNEEETMMRILELEQLKRNLVLFQGHHSLVERLSSLGRVVSAVARRTLTGPEFLGFLRKVRREEVVARRLAEEAAKLGNPAAVAGEGEAGKLRVTVVEGRRLPRMDLLGALDPYCLVFLAGDNVDVLPYMCRPFRTCTVHHNQAPVWNQTFDLSVSSGDRHLVVMVFDEDLATASELVGCATVHLEDVRRDGVETEAWVELDRPANYAGWTSPLLSPQVKLRYTFRLPPRAPSELDHAEEHEEGEGIF